MPFRTSLPKVISIVLFGAIIIYLAPNGNQFRITQLEEISSINPYIKNFKEKFEPAFPSFSHSTKQNDNTSKRYNIPNSPGYTTYNSNDFESGWGIWNDGGADSSLEKNYESYSRSGKASIRLRDNSGKASSMHTQVMDLTGMTAAKVSFTCLPISLENGEVLAFEVSINGGDDFNIIKEWSSGSDLYDNIPNELTVNVFSKMLSANSVFRIRCDASSNNDEVYIDDVIIETSTDEKLSEPIAENPIDKVNITTISALTLYPKPVINDLNLELRDGNSRMVKATILSHFGKEVKSYKLKNTTNSKLSVSSLPGGQTYLVMVTSDTGDSFIEKFIKL